MQTWLILGASSAIARAFARAAAARGHALLLAGRDLDDMAATAADCRLRHGVPAEALSFDALDYAAHEDFVAECRRRAPGTLNVFLAFGAMPPQEEMERDFAQARLAIESNFLGAVSVLSRLAPLLESQGAGSLLAIGSVAGDRGRLKNYVYGSAKAGLHAYLQGLRARLARAGVSVTTVKPGFVDTAMTWGLPGMFLVASPQQVAEACLGFAEKGALVRYVPAFWWIIMTILKHIPERIFVRLNI